MFSSFSTSTQYGGRAKIKRKLFSKRETHSSQSEGGLDLKKIKGKHCVETWATISDCNSQIDHEQSSNIKEKFQEEIKDCISVKSQCRSEKLNVTEDDTLDSNLIFIPNCKTEIKCKVEVEDLEGFPR